MTSHPLDLKVNAKPFLEIFMRRQHHEKLLTNSTWLAQHLHIYFPQQVERCLQGSKRKGMEVVHCLIHGLLILTLFQSLSLSLADPGLLFIPSLCV